MKPILFNEEMVNAILSGRKTQTRRLIKGINPFHAEDYDGRLMIEDRNGDYVPAENFCRYQKGDTLYVRETWCVCDASEAASAICFGYKASGASAWKHVNEFDYNKIIGNELGGWHPSIHMPKSAARIFLEVENVRAERLHDISAAGIKAEGVESGDINDFKRLWDSVVSLTMRHIYGWEANPWVYVIEFKEVSDV
jgi:hypothetical protein